MVLMKRYCGPLPLQQLCLGGGRRPKRALLRPKVEGMVMMRSPLGTMRLGAQVARLRHAPTRSLRVGRLLTLLLEGIAPAIASTCRVSRRRFTIYPLKMIASRKIGHYS